MPPRGRAGRRRPASWVAKPARSAASASAAQHAEMALRQATADLAQLQREQARTIEQLGEEAADRRRLAAERDGLARERQEHVNWQQNLSASLTFRMLRRIDRLRAFLTGRSKPS